MIAKVTLESASREKSASSSGVLCNYKCPYIRSVKLVVTKTAAAYSSSRVGATVDVLAYFGLQDHLHGEELADRQVADATFHPGKSIDAAVCGGGATDIQLSGTVELTELSWGGARHDVSIVNKKRRSLLRPENRRFELHF